VVRIHRDVVCSADATQHSFLLWSERLLTGAPAHGANGQQQGPSNATLVASFSTPVHFRYQQPATTGAVHRPPPAW
jgi:hypothetical protein